MTALALALAVIEPEYVYVYDNPPFPSLYNPTFDSTVDGEGYFLHDANAQWEFTLIWTIILTCGVFCICAGTALVNLLLSRFVWRPQEERDHERAHAHAHGGVRPLYSTIKPLPLWLFALIPVCMAATAAFVSLVSGTVVGFALAAIYAAGGFSMSTWVPFLWGLIQVVVLIISSYSSLTRLL